MVVLIVLDSRSFLLFSHFRECRYGLVYKMEMLETETESLNSSTSSKAMSETSSNPSSVHLPHKEKSFKNPLNFFKTLKNSKNPSKGSSSRVPKKEYLRCKLIRGCKKFMRHLAQKKDPHKITKFKKTTPKIKRIWEKMQKFREFNLETLEEFSKTDTTLSDEVYKSYNSKFCSRFFENLLVRKVFRQYIKLLFVDFEVNRLEKEFNFSCCVERKHDDFCLFAWEELKKYILSEMVDEVLGIEEKVVKSKEKAEVKVEEKKRDEEIERESCKFSVMKCLDLQPKWIQRYYLMDLHII